MTGQKPREIAALALQRRESGTDYIENILAQDLASAPLRPDDRNLALELTYGAVRQQAVLDWMITRKTPGRAQKKLLQILLRLGLYQLFWLDRIPDHAAVHETVELAKQLGHGPQAGFINAVLRGYLREKEATTRLLDDLAREQPALAASHPEWLYERWSRRWGVEKTAQLMKWNNTPPKNFARANTLRADAGQLLEAWRENEKVEYDFVPRDWLIENTAFLLKSHPSLDQLPSFKNGWFYVQDPSTLLAVMELDPRPGDKVLDLCSAPGGKTTFIAQQMQDNGAILAQDTSPERLALVRENCLRLGVRIVETEVTPQSTPRERLGLFDRVLLDAPCSNTGVMRRRVDLRWRIRPEEIRRLTATQLELLRSAASQVKPGGTLVYSTCSLEPEENAEVIRAFLSENSSFTLERERELVPFLDEVDGAYVARLTRTS